MMVGVDGLWLSSRGLPSPVAEQSDSALGREEVGISSAPARSVLGDLYGGRVH